MYGRGIAPEVVVNYYEVLGYPLLLVAVLEIILGIIVLHQNPARSPVNRSVAVFSFASAGYSLFGAIMYVRIAHGITDIDIFARASWIGWLSIPAALQVLYYLDNDKSRTARIIGYVLYPFWTILLLLTLFTDLVEPPGYRLNPYIDQHGPLENPARMIGGIMILWIILESYLLQRRSEGAKKQQIIHFSIGTAIFAGGSLVLAVLIQVPGGFGLDPGLGAFFSFPWALLTFYAIMRYSLFDIRVIVSRTLGIVFLWTGFIVFQLTAYHFLSRSIGDDLAIAVTLTLIAFLLYGIPLNRWTQAWAQRIILKDKYQYQNILNDSIKAILTILDQQKLVVFIIESIRKSMGAGAVYLYWLHPSGRYDRLQGYGPLIDSGEEASFPLEISRFIEKTGQAVMRDDPARITQEENENRLAAYMQRIGVDLMVPLVYEGAFKGVLALGARDSREPYRRSDLNLLETLAGHTAMAMENANLYEEAKQARESLRESEEKFRALANTLPAGIFIHRGGKFLYANPAVDRVTGYSLDEILKMDFWSVTHPDYRQMIIDRGRNRLHGNQPPPQYEFKILRKDGGERWVLMTAGTIEYEGGPAVIGTIFDVTERKLAEEERERLNEENVKQYRERIEEEMRHQQEKEKILRDLHDGIGGITTNISLLAEMARQSDKLSDIKKSLATISSLAREGLADVRGFMHSLDARDLSWQSFTAELRTQGKSMLEPHGMSFQFQHSLNGNDTAPGSLMCLNLFRIFKEALTNIIKHSKARTVTANLDVSMDKVVLSIADDGIGLSKAAGSGRGLANMRTRSKELGGDVTMTSDKGSTIRVEVPVPGKYPGRGMVK